ncbi:hypothetical protein Vretifemale_11833, partial [Volvox reticuliferus]
TGRPPHLRAASLTSFLGAQGHQSMSPAAAMSAGAPRGSPPAALTASTAWPSPTAAVGASGQAEPPPQVAVQPQVPFGPCHYSHHQPLALCAVGTSVRTSVSQEAPARATLANQETSGKTVTEHNGTGAEAGGEGGSGVAVMESRHVTGWASSPQAPASRKPALPPEARASSAAAARAAAAAAAAAGAGSAVADTGTAVDGTVVPAWRRPTSLRPARTSHPRDLLQQVRRAASVDGSGSSSPIPHDEAPSPAGLHRRARVSSAGAGATEHHVVEETARAAAMVKKKSSALAASGAAGSAIKVGSSSGSAAAKTVGGRKGFSKAAAAAAGGSGGGKAAKAVKRGSSGTKAKAARAQALTSAEGPAGGAGAISKSGAAGTVGTAAGAGGSAENGRPAGLGVAGGLLLRRVAPDLSVIPEETGSASGSMGAPEAGSGQMAQQIEPQSVDAQEAVDSSKAATFSILLASSGMPAGAGALLSGSVPETPAFTEIPRKEKARRGVPRELDAELFQLGRILGSGSFATVYLARQVDTGAKVVVKRLDRRPGGRAAQSEAENEVAILTRAGSHPNLVEFRGWYRDPKDGVMCLVMGYCAGGTLAQLIKNPPACEAGRGPGGGSDAAGAFGTIVSAGGAGGSAALGGTLEADALAAAALQRASYFPEDVVMLWFVQLLLALHHLHGRKIMHRDLKPDNIFLASNRRVIKLGDLGVAKQLEGTFELAITCLGTPYYMSPECLASRPYTYASDIWSLGCVLYEMAARRTAFEALGLPQLMFKILRVAYDPLPPQFSRPFQQLVNSMLRADPDDRPTTLDLLSHPFVRRHLKRLLDISARKVISSGPADRVSAMPPKVKPSEARSAVKKLERASGGGKKRRGMNAAAAAVDDLAAGVGLRPFSTGGAGGGGAGARLNSPSAYGVAVGPGPAAGCSGAGGGGARVKNVLQWDSGARYEARRQQQVEMRFRAREFEQRITREQVRQQRRERDPAVRARAAELEAVRQELLARRERKQAQVAEQEILEERLSEPHLDLGDELAAFRTRDKLRRTRLGPASPGAESPGFNCDEGEWADEHYLQDGDDVDVDIPEEYDFACIEGEDEVRYEDGLHYASGRSAVAGAGGDGGDPSAAGDAIAPGSDGAAGRIAATPSGCVPEGDAAGGRVRRTAEAIVPVVGLGAEVPLISDIGQELMDQALLDSLAEEERQRASALLNGSVEWHEALPSLAGRELYATTSSSARATSMSRTVSSASARAAYVGKGASGGASMVVTTPGDPTMEVTTPMSIARLSPHTVISEMASDPAIPSSDADAFNVEQPSVNNGDAAGGMQQLAEQQQWQMHRQAAARQQKQQQDQVSENDQGPYHHQQLLRLPGTLRKQHRQSRQFLVLEATRTAGSKGEGACTDDEVLEHLDATDAASAQTSDTAQGGALAVGTAEGIDDGVSGNSGDDVAGPEASASLANSNGTIVNNSAPSAVGGTSGGGVKGSGSRPDSAPGLERSVTVAAVLPPRLPQCAAAHLSPLPLELISQEPSDIEPFPVAARLLIAGDAGVARSGATAAPRQLAAKDDRAGHNCSVLDRVASYPSSGAISEHDAGDDCEDSSEEEIEEEDEEEDEEEEEEEDEEEEEAESEEEGSELEGSSED